MSGTPPRHVIFYFDPISPYAWLAAQDLAHIELQGLTVDCRPVLFAALLNAHGQKGPAEIAAKRVALFRDVMRLAAQRGVSFSGPPTHPFNPLYALRVCTAVSDAVQRKQLAVALMNGAWMHGRDISVPSEVDDIVAQCGLDSAALAAQAITAGNKQALTAATTAAIEAGVFGVPTFSLDGELFWGADRIESLLWRARGHTIDEAALARFLQRGASAQRKPTQD
ncbi:MAG TPA: DsbA family protein [Burkholderiaceae bacterium]